MIVRRIAGGGCRQIPQRKIALLLSLCLACAPALRAAGLRVTDIRANLFYAHTGALSENIVGSKKEFFNTIIGEGDAGGPASHVLIDLVLVNAAGSGVSSTAALKVTWRARGKDASLTRSFENSTCAEGEVRHQAVLIENATCAPVRIEASAGKTPPKLVILKFGCGE